MSTLSDISSTNNRDDSNLMVALRIRPMNDEEIINGATPIAHRIDENLVVLLDPQDDVEDVLRQNRSREKQFVFDVVLDAKATQEEVYRKTCRFLIPSVINGYNSTVFAYGPTGAGKTYTMLGRDHDKGVMVQSLTELFHLMQKSEHENVYRVTMSYLEIYNEMIRDLLNPSSGYLDLREDQKGVQVAGLSEHSAASTEEVMKILMEGNKQRTQEPTAANQTSSRSHAVLMISVRQRNRTQGIRQQVRLGRLFLIDLAGSERAANTQNRGKRMVEGAHINRSLLALGNCINALSDKSGSKYINYRDSKLTRLLKDALGGNCKTVMIAHISPASFFFEESRNTLSYADRAKTIKTKIRQNVVDMTLHITQYSKIIGELRDEIRYLKQKLEQQGQQQRNLSALTAIQSEVMKSDRHTDETEVNRLKKELLNVYQRQVQLRRNLVELNNAEAEYNLESNRIQLDIKRWERENLLASSQAKDEDVELVLPHSASEIGRAREALNRLSAERENSDRHRLALEKELENIKSQSYHIEQEFKRCGNTPLHQELLRLLSRIHAVEMENTRLQSDLLNRSLELKRRELFIVLQDHHLAMSEDLIKQHRKLTEGETVAPTLDVYDVYEQEAQDLKAERVRFLPAIEYEGKKDPQNGTLRTALSRASDARDHLPHLQVIDQEYENGDRLFRQTPDSTSSSKIEEQEATRRDVEDFIFDNENSKQRLHRPKKTQPASLRRFSRDSNDRSNNRSEETKLTQKLPISQNRRYTNQISSTVMQPSSNTTKNRKKLLRGRVRAMFQSDESGDDARSKDESNGISPYRKQNTRRKMETVQEGSGSLNDIIRDTECQVSPVSRSKSLSRPKEDKDSFAADYSKETKAGKNSKKPTEKSTGAAIPSYRYDDFGVTGYKLQ